MPIRRAAAGVKRGARFSARLPFFCSGASGRSAPGSTAGAHRLYTMEFALVQSTSSSTLAKATAVTVSAAP